MLILASLPGAAWCPECGRFTPLDELSTDRRASDGTTGYRKPCTPVRNAASKATADVRGILCSTRDVGLGSVDDDEPDRLLLAHRYLTRPRSAAERLRRLTLGRAS